MKKKSSIWFDTAADAKPFYKVLTRSTYPVTKQVFDIQKIKNRDKDCEECENTKADFRVIKQRHNPFTVYLCYKCIETETTKWLNEQLENLKQELERYQVAEEL